MKTGKLAQALESSIEILEDLVSSLPAEKLERNRGEGFWTIHEHLNHLAVVQLMLFKRMELFCTEENPAIKPYVPEDIPEEKKPAPKPVKELLDFFKKWRKRQVALLESAEPAVWKKTAAHPEYDLYTFEILVRHILLHDYFHMHRIEELWLVKDRYLTKL